MKPSILRRLLCAALALCLVLGILPGTQASAQDMTFDFARLADSARDGSWGVTKTRDGGALTIRFAQQYAEQRFDLPAELKNASVSRVTVQVAQGDTAMLSIKLLRGAEQAAVAYNTAAIQTDGVRFDGVGIMSLSESGGEYVLEGITFTLEPGASEERIPLKELYAEDFRIGVACEAISHWRNSLSEIGNPDKEALISDQFNTITFGNELKPAYNMAYSNIKATETDLPFGHNRAAIEMLDWAKANHMPVRGHTLIWHSQCEDAVFCKNYKPVYRKDYTLDPDCLVDAETMKLRMESYIHHVMEYIYANGYGDVIYAWDVVNEAIEPGANANNMRPSYWYQIIGPEFLYDAFKYTREAVEKYSAEYAALYGIDPDDPEALKAIQPALFYNDYNEFQPAKRDAILKAVAPIAADGYLDGIGMQAHVSDTTDIDAFITALNMYSQAVSQVHITELDVSQSTSGPNADYYQAVFYHDLFAALLEARKNGANLTSVTIWGLTDDNSWKKETSPLIFNGDLSPKLAYTGIVSAKTGAAMPEPEYVAPDFTDGIFTFNERDAEAAALGFVKRGDGKVFVQSEETYSGRGAIRNTGRTASWNGTSFDVSRFVGQTILVNAWVKTEDPQVRLTADIDGVWPNIASVSTAGGSWTQITGVYTVPASLNALSLYFETNGTADIFIDEVTVKLVGMDEGFEAADHTALPRGVGHMPVLTAANGERHSGSKALKVSRQAREATVSFDISKYVGRVVEIAAWVKTGDSTIRLGLEGTDQAVEAPAAQGWTEIRGTFSVPADRTSAQCYIETDGIGDFWVDDLSVRIGTAFYDLEDGVQPFSPRWQGAGKLTVVEEDGNHVLKLSDQDQKYYGICYDVTPFLGMEVQIRFDVKTDDRTVKVTGDIDNVWPNLLTAGTAPGEYKTVSGVVRLPGDLSALRIYIETPGTADLYIDNFSIGRTEVK